MNKALQMQIAVIAGCLIAAVLGYLVVGRPGMADQPMADRQASLAQKIAEAPDTLTPAETLSRLEQTVIERPEEPEPHYFIGQMLLAQNRPEDAVRAFQSALRRDDAFIPALVGLADTLVEISGGAVGPDATRLYARAYELDPDGQVRSGMWAAMGAAQAGDQEKAEQAMAYILSQLPEDDPRRMRIEGMLAGMDRAE